jgi:hypothetical protein
MKYRLLSDEELSHLEPELKQFLIVNGVHSEEWEKINKTEPEKALELIKLFSDSVLQSVYERIKFIEFRSPGSFLIFAFEPDRIRLMSINRKEGSSVDLSSPESLHLALTNSFGQLEFFRSEKNYLETREKELHKMIEQGCVPSVQELWDMLEKALLNEQNTY